MLQLFDFSLKMNGFPIEKAKKDFLAIAQLSAQAKKEFVAKQKEEIVRFHYQNTPFYKNLVGSTLPQNWEDVPIVTKFNLQQPLQNRLSNGFTLKNIYVGKTSGSSGTPFIFAKDNYCHALTWASNMARFAWHGVDFNQSYQARFYGIPKDFFGYYKERIKDFFARRYRFSIFNMSDVVLEKFLIKFQQKKFDYINGYTSSLVLFAKFLQIKNIVLKQICPSLQACFVTSEMLFPEDKILLEKQFGIPIYNEYGASELDLIAFENPQGEWLLNTETLFVEIVDENNKVVANGTEGRIVITSLFNKAHPFIRYDIGDFGCMDEKSTPEKPILKQLLGRTNDVAILPSGKKAPGLTFYYITKTIIEDTALVKEFVIVQNEKNSFEISYVSETDLSTSQIQKIEAAITNYLEPNLQFKFYRKAFLNRNKRGKLKQFTSLVVVEN